MLNLGKAIKYTTTGLKVIGAVAIAASVYKNRKN